MRQPLLRNVRRSWFAEMRFSSIQDRPRRAHCSSIVLQQVLLGRLIHRVLGQVPLWRPTRR